MREFEAAVKATEEEEGVDIPLIKRGVDGEVIERKVLKAYRPDDAQFAMLMASTGRGSTLHNRIAGYINFFVNIFDEEDAAYLESRLLDRRDSFGVEQVDEIMDYLAEEWTGNPTQLSSDSTPSPQTDGQKSTQPSLLST